MGTSSRIIRESPIPELTIHLVKGAGGDIGVVHLFEDIYRSSEPRMYMEYMQPPLEKWYMKGRLGAIAVIADQDLEFKF